jgi:hypothetical protein
VGVRAVHPAECRGSQPLHSLQHLALLGGASGEHPGGRRLGMRAGNCRAPASQLPGASAACEASRHPAKGEPQLRV